MDRFVAAVDFDPEVLAYIADDAKATSAMPLPRLETQLDFFI